MAVAAASAALGAALLAACAPDVAPETLRAVIRVESGGKVLALHVNGPVALAREPTDPVDAAAMARAALAEGYRSLTAGFRNGYVARYASEETTMPSAPAVRGADPYIAGTSIFTRKERTMETSNSRHSPLFTRDLAGLEIPGAVVEVDPETAEQMGAFEETALSEEEAAAQGGHGAVAEALERGGEPQAAERGDREQLPRHQRGVAHGHGAGARLQRPSLAHV